MVSAPRATMFPVTRSTARSWFELSTVNNVVPSRATLTMFPPPSDNDCNCSPVRTSNARRFVPTAAYAMPSKTSTCPVETLSVCRSTDFAGSLTSTKCNPPAFAATTAIPRPASNATSVASPAKSNCLRTAGCWNCDTSTTARPNDPVAR